MEQSGFRIPEHTMFSQEQGSGGRLHPKSKKIPSPTELVRTSELDVSERKRRIARQGGPDETLEGEEIEELAQEILFLPEKMQKMEEISPVGKAEEEGALSEQFAQMSLSEDQVVPMEVDYIDYMPLDVVMDVVDPIDILEPMMVEGPIAHSTGGSEFSLGPSCFDVEMVVAESVPEPPATAGELLTTAGGEGAVGPPIVETTRKADEVVLKRTEEPLSQELSAPLTPKERAEKHVLQAQRYMDREAYGAAYRLLLPMARGPLSNREVLLKTAICLEKMGRYKESLIIFRELRKREPKNLQFAEKIGDLLFLIGDYIRAQIIYKKLQKIAPGQGEGIEQKIQRCQGQLRSLARWGSFQEIFASIGASDEGPLTQRQVQEIDRINKQLVQTNVLMWDLFFLQTRKLSPSYLKKHFVPVVLRSADGRTFTAYKSSKFRFLAHFSSMENGKKILEKELLAQQDPAVREGEDYFWNSQYKVCASILRFGMRPFQLCASSGIGFVLDVPDPGKNILHAFVRDTWTPSYVKPDAGTPVTKSGSEKTAIEYNEFMLRYQVLSEYVYSVWQHADREARYQQVLERIDKFQPQDSQNPILRLVFAGIRCLKTLLGCPDENATAIKNLLEQLKALCQSPTMDHRSEKKILSVMKKVERYLDSVGQSEKRDVVRKERKEVEREFTATVMAPDKITSPSLFDTNRPLIIGYLDATIAIVESLLAKNPQLEEALFERIFYRRRQPGEQILSQLREIRQTMSTHLERALPRVSKKTQGAQDRAIFCRQLSPNEVCAGTRADVYSEVGVRSHVSSHEVHAGRANFKAVVISQESVRDGCITREQADLLEKAQKASLPIIYI